MFAVSLAANAAAGDAPADPLAPVRDHLKAQSPEALIALILDLADRDDALLRRLEIAAAAAGKSDAAGLEARLRKAIDAATRTRGFIEYRAVRAWAEGVEEALDALEDLVAGPQAATALRLADHALARIGAAIGEIDDSSGHGSALLEHARDIHLAACEAARPDQVALARDLFARETGGGYDTFHAAAELYAGPLGDAGRAEYRRLAAKAWDALPPRGPRDRNRHEFNAAYGTIAGIIDRFAEADGDVSARIALRGKDLATPWNYARLADFCREHGRDAEALARAEEGLWTFEDAPPDERLLRIATELLIEAGRQPAAEAHLWRAFERAPSLDLYRSLRELGGEPARDRALAALEARLLAARHDRWSIPGDLVVRVLIAEGRFDRAWEIARAHRLGQGLAETLARASEASHPREALAVYAEEVDRLVRSGGNRAYAEAVQLIARMARLRPEAEQAAYLADMKLRFARKRNFIKLLE
jgi:hypothetical protein